MQKENRTLYTVKEARVGVAGENAIDFSIELATNPPEMGREARAGRFYYQRRN